MNSTDIDTQSKFYDQWTEKFVLDYLIGNKRTESAILLALSWIPEESEQILDLGCGIGWSTYCIANKFDRALVYGLDLSENSILAANELFRRKNNCFYQENMLDIKWKKRTDCFVLLDVFEHIAKNERNEFYDFVKQNLKEEGRIIMTCPSKYHQMWLEKNNPTGLQPIDETISFEDILDLGRNTDTEIVYYGFANVAHNKDYFHVVLEKRTPFDEIVYKRLDDKLIERQELRVKRIKNSKYKHVLRDYYSRNRKTNIFLRMVKKISNWVSR